MNLRDWLTALVGISKYLPLSELLAFLRSALPLPTCDEEVDAWIARVTPASNALVAIVLKAILADTKVGVSFTADDIEEELNNIAAADPGFDIASLAAIIPIILQIMEIIKAWRNKSTTDPVL